MIVIYHGGGCDDGYTAAWAARCRYPDAQFIPASYGELPTYAERSTDCEFKGVQLAGQDVLIVDFSFPRADLVELHDRTKSLRVLDHHKTAAADLEGLDFCTFDMSRSGAGVTWDELHPDAIRPMLIDYVEDRDLWKWTLRDSKEINAYIATVPKTFEDWQELAEELDDDIRHDLGRVVRLGRTALAVVDQYLERQREHAYRITVAGIDVPCINTTFAHSELVGALAEGEAFAVGWYVDNAGKVRVSLRGRKGGEDVSQIAKRFGGGGHPGAAGFELPRPPMPGAEIGGAL